MRVIPGLSLSQTPVPPLAAAAIPTAFGHCLGWLHPAPGSVGVLLVSAWGFDEFCARRSWRQLAERFAGDGRPTLRFDLPDTGSSLPVPRGVEGWTAWQEALAQAADHLRASSAAEQIILVGMGLGAALAAVASPQRADVAALGLLAPVVSGPAYLREIALWSRVLESRNSKPFSSPVEADQVAGFELSPSMRKAVGEIDLLSLAQAPSCPVWIAGQTGRASDVRLAERLTALGGSVTSTPFRGFERLAGNPLFPATPDVTYAELIGWTRRVAPSSPCSDVAPPALSPKLTSSTRIEEGVRIASGAGLYGVLTQPRRRAATGRSVLFLSTSRDPHIGRGRMVVEWARALANAGTASLRVDCADVGDSPPRPGGPNEVIFNPSQKLDVIAALDWLEQRGMHHPVLVGRCSGAHLAMQAALADARVRDIVLINPSRLILDPRESIDHLLRPPLERYAHRILDKRSLFRLLQGEVAVKQAAGRIATRVKSVVSRPFTAAGWTTDAALKDRFHGELRKLSARDVSVRIICGDHDIESHAQLDRYFGEDRRLLNLYPNLKVVTLTQADHNLSTKTSQTQMLRLLKQLSPEGRSPGARRTAEASINRTRGIKFTTDRRVNNLRSGARRSSDAIVAETRTAPSRPEVGGAL